MRILQRKWRKIGTEMWNEITIKCFTKSIDQNHNKESNDQGAKKGPLIGSLVS